MSCSIPLSYLSTEVATVSWSGDERIAVTTAETVYIITLKGVTHAVSSKGKPPFVMTTAPLPDKPHPPNDEGVLPVSTYSPSLTIDPGTPLHLPAFSPSLGKAGMAPFLDRTISVGCAQTSESFTASGWSPSGCSYLGGCLLTCLTSSSRLLLYSPPGCSTMRWKLVADITDLYCSLLQQCDFNPSSLPLVETTMPPDTKKTETINIPFAEFIRRKVMVACTVFAWHPNIQTNGSAVVAMATRSGHVTLWELKLPLLKENSPELSLLRVVELPVKDGWVCSLNWHCSTTSTSLIAGCTNGLVLWLFWHGSEVTQPRITTIWPCADGVGVYHIAWEDKSGSGQDIARENKDSSWVVFDKGPSLHALHVTDPSGAEDNHSSIPPGPDSIPPYVLICGIHTMPISGLCPVSDGSFISTSLDGSVQVFTLPDKEGHVTPRVVSMDTVPSGQIVTAQGIAVSLNGIFAAVAINPRCDFSYNKKRFRSQLHFMTLVDSAQVDKKLNQRVGPDWDLCEYIRQEYAQELQLPSYVERYLSSRFGKKHRLNRSESEYPRLSQLKFKLQMFLISQRDGIRLQLELILCRHMVGTLEDWEENRAELDHLSRVSLCRMCHWVQSSEYSKCREIELAQKVLRELGDVNTAESCPVCGAGILFLNLLQEMCPNGHTWKRCTITFTLVSESQCSRCILCEAVAHNQRSLQAPPSSWLHHLLLSTTRCIVCNGHYEQVV